MRTAPTPMPTAAGYAGREVTQPPDWHGLVVWDVFLNAVTTGLFLAAAVAELYAPARFAAVAAVAYPVALAVLLVDLLCLVADLGDPLRFHHMLRVFKPSSPMSLGTWCLTAYSLPLTALAGLSVGRWMGLIPADCPTAWWVHRGAVVAGLLPGLGAVLYKGVLFSTTSQPGWRDARWLGGYHVNSAIAAGAAGLLGLAAVTGDAAAADALRRPVAVLAVFHLVPLALLARELGPTLAARYTRGELVLAGLVILAGAAAPAVAVVVSQPAADVAAVGLALAGQWVVRRLVVLLPQPRH